MPRLLVILLAVIVSGCAAAERSQSPEVSLISFEPTLEAPGAGFLAALEVDNPSREPLRLDALTFNLLLDDYALASGVRNMPLDVPARSTLRVDMPVSVPTRDVAMLFVLGMADGLPYAARGQAWQGAPLDRMIAYGSTGTLRLAAAPAAATAALPRYRAVED